MDLHHVSKACLYSTVKNISGKSLQFSFLPPHGVRLDVDEEYTVFGDIIDRFKTHRGQQAFAAAIDAGLITIVATPSPIFTDTGNGHIKMLTLHNNSLSAIDPCWDTSDSLDIDVPA